MQDLTLATSMTLEVLSQITRRATLARAMGLRATELNTLMALIRQRSPGPDLFQPPARTWTLLQFVEAVDLLSGVNLSVSDLGGIYLDRGPSASAAAELFATVLPQLEEGFAQIAADSVKEEPETAVGSAPTIDPLLAQLGFVVDDSTTAQAVLAAMDGTSRQSVPLPGAPIIPAPIDKRLTFQPKDDTRGIAEATLSLRGRLTETEVATLKALPTVGRIPRSR